MNEFDQDEDARQYRVVVNHEDQYSIWPVEREIPSGWFEVGRAGTRQECLEYIEKVWTDMRPRSLRDALQQWGKAPGAKE